MFKIVNDKHREFVLSMLDDLDSQVAELREIVTDVPAADLAAEPADEIKAKWWAEHCAEIRRLLGELTYYVGMGSHL